MEERVSNSPRGFQQYKRRDVHNVKVGEVVLVYKARPRNAWLLGVDEELEPGGDGAVRGGWVRSKGGITLRPITKLYLIEINWDL